MTGLVYVIDVDKNSSFLLDWCRLVYIRVLYWKILFVKQIHNCSKLFLIKKLTYKFPLCPSRQLHVQS